MKNGLYHKDLGLPAGVLSAFVGTRRPSYTRHSLTEFLADRYAGAKLPPASLTVAPEHVVEVEVLNGRAVKIVARIPHTEQHDLVLALCNPEPGSVTVKTLWLNDRNDTHKTLRRELYITP